MAVYNFEVQETTVRSAIVEADTLTEARALLREWADQRGSMFSGNEPPLILGDLQTTKIVTRVKA